MDTVVANWKGMMKSQSSSTTSMTDDARLSALLAEVSAPAGPLADLLDSMTPEEVRRNEAPDPGAQIDRAEELREKWQTERGQLWTIGGHRLMCGDSTNAEDVARLMGGERAALMATDPPYLVNYRGGNHPQTWANGPAKRGEAGPELRDKHWDDYEEGDRHGTDSCKRGEIGGPPSLVLSSRHGDARDRHPAKRAGDAVRDLTRRGRRGVLRRR